MRFMLVGIMSIGGRLRRNGLPIATALTLCVGAATAARGAPYDFNAYEVTSFRDGVNSLHRADKLLEGDFTVGNSATQETPVVNFESNDRQRLQFPGALPFAVDQPKDSQNLAMNITGEVDIPEPGVWSLGVNSNGGFRLTIDGQSMHRKGIGAGGDRIAPFTFEEAGTYALDLTYYQHARNAKLELFDSEGRFHRFHARGADWHLLGDSGDGGLALADDSAVTPPADPPSNDNVGPDLELAAVPEPSGLILVSIAAPWLLRRRRRNYDVSDP
jgi:hypothetical protein